LNPSSNNNTASGRVNGVAGTSSEEEHILYNNSGSASKIALSKVSNEVELAKIKAE
jgi:hypothetical protein